MRHDGVLLAHIDRPAPAIVVRAPDRWRWLLVGLWFAACVWLLVLRWPAVTSLTLPDTDDNLRLLEVRDWLAGQGWFDLRQYRLDPPGGADIHWSRLVDLPLAGVILLLRPFFGNGTAEIVAAAGVPLLTLLVAMGLLALVARRAIAREGWVWAPALLLMATPALGMMSPLRIDHHGWQIVTVLALLFGLIDTARRRGGRTAGIAIAASLTIGVEMLPYLAAGLALAAIGWILEPGDRERLRAMAEATAAGVLLSLAIFVPPAARAGFGCDALTLSYALPFVVGGVALAAAARFDHATRRQRLLMTVGAGLLTALALLPGGGACLIDPYRAIDPDARRLWLNIVSEALPLRRQPLEVALASLALPAVGLSGALLMLRRHRRLDPWPWIVILTLSALSILFSLAQTRSAITAQAIAVPGAAALGWLGRRRLTASGSMLVRVLGSVLLFLCVSAIVPRFAIAAIAGEPPKPGEAAADAANAACMRPSGFAALDMLPPATMLGFIDSTPALLLHSHHRGLAGPYHRNGRAIADLMQAWAGGDAQAHAILKHHEIGYVLLCGRSSEAEVYDRRGPRGLHARLMRGDAPRWLAPQPVAGTRWRVWRVTRATP